MLKSINGDTNVNTIKTFPVEKDNVKFKKKQKTHNLERTPQKDTVEKKGLSKGAKIGIGAGIITLLALVLTKGKFAKKGLSGTTDDIIRGSKNKGKVTIEEVSLDDLPEHLKKNLDEKSKKGFEIIDEGK